VKHTGTLRWRLTLTLSIGVTLLWLLLASALLWGVRNQVQHTLDSRLAASAQMVASLMEQQQLVRASASPVSSESAPANLVALPPFPASLACRVTTVNGSVLAQSRSAPAGMLNDVPSGYSSQEVDGEHWRVYRYLQDDLEVVTAERLATRDNLMNAIVMAAALPFVLALAGTLAIAWIGIKRSLAPLRQLGAHIAARDTRLLQPLVWKRAPTEIQPLLEEINRLLARVGDAMQRERRFSGDAAHELRTPLTAINTHLQVAQLTEGDQATHALEQAARAVERMHGTVDQLLLLARLDSNTTFDDVMTAEGRDIAEAVCEELCTRTGSARIHINRCTESMPVIVPAALLAVALRNLLDNALRFSPPESVVEFDMARDKASAVFRIRDYGSGVPPQELTRLTHRFVTLQAPGGSGLGLAITETIAVRFGGQLRLRNAEPGLEAELRLPLAPDAEVSAISEDV
jgi:signal transduction histidine kinase